MMEVAEIRGEGPMMKLPTINISSTNGNGEKPDSKFGTAVINLRPPSSGDAVEGDIMYPPANLGAPEIPVKVPGVVEGDILT